MLTVLRPILICLLLCAAPLTAQGQLADVPTPRSHFGFDPGDARRLAGWDELLSYYERVAAASDRVVLDTLGATTGGRPMVMLTITSPANHARLSELREIQSRLADPRTVANEREREALEAQARAVVLVTAQIHSTEVGAGLMPVNLVYRLSTSAAPDLLRILDEVVLLLIPSLNPDGTQMVADWYRRYLDTPYEGIPPVDLYHHYVGHDNNRDWYALTQKETQLTVAGALNAWHPVVVHDVHQMEHDGARMFVPPYAPPTDPNIDPLLLTAMDRAGREMGAALAAEGRLGVISGVQYDLYSPARSYSVYRGAARILTETASVALASPISLLPWQLTETGGTDVTVPSPAFPSPWPGGVWDLRQIVDYQESATLALLRSVSRNRHYWVHNFFEVNRRAVAGWRSRPDYWVVPANQPNEVGLKALLRVLTLGEVEVRRAERSFSARGREFPAGSYVIPMNQPAAAWAQTLLEVQEYPRLPNSRNGAPRRPYDVTAHTLPLLMGVEAYAYSRIADLRLSPPVEPVEVQYQTPAAFLGAEVPRIGLYRGHRESLAAGWTRWLFDTHGLPYTSLGDADIRAGDLESRFDVVIFQDQPAFEIIDGWSEREMPAPYTGGIGIPGAVALQRFVQRGGRVIAIEGATDLVIELFDLPVRNRVNGLLPESFFIPGSIVSLDAESTQVVEPIPAARAAWFSRSGRAFDVRSAGVDILSRYGAGDVRLSGLVTGGRHIAGQPAVVETRVGAGSVVLFGFQPNYRGQSIATWPMLFHAMTWRSNFDRLRETAIRGYVEVPRLSAPFPASYE